VNTKPTKKSSEEKPESADKSMKELSPIVRKYRGILKGKIKNNKKDRLEHLSTKHLFVGDKNQV
jgi:hypothetical protein